MASTTSTKGPEPRAAAGSTELYTPEQLARVDALMLASLARRRSTFPYAERFMQGRAESGA